MTAALELRALADDLRRLGVRPGQDLLVHTSLSSLGPVAGGPATLLEALRTAAPGATIVVPTHTAGNSTSSTRYRVATAGLTDARLAGYVDDMPGFDPAVTPSSGMGVFAEYVRKSPDAVRSTHPQTSFAAIGPRAAECVAGHALECHLGELSPLGWLDRNGAWALLLGVGYTACTAFHLAEYRLPDKPPPCVYSCYVMVGNRRESRVFTDLALDDSDFEAIGERIDGEPFVRHGQVGAADCRLIPVRDAVRFALSSPSFRRLRMPGARRHEVRDREVMTRTAAPEGVATSRYFFLSYPRLCPLPDVADVGPEDRPDEWVRLFNGDLTEAVKKRATADSALRPGFLDVGGPAAPGWRTTLVDALSSAEVFVPLLSAEYVRRSWPRREWASFERRLEDSRVREPQRRLAPVLWVPPPAGERPPEFADALSLARGAARTPYEEFGLLALLRLDIYHGFYRQIVGELAERIVALAEQTPVSPSPAPDPGQLQSPVSAEGTGRVFVVAVATPGGAPGGSWRPFGAEHRAPLAEYAVRAVERRDFAVVTVEFEKSAELLRRMPGLVLIDPSYAAGAEAAATLDELVAALPSWAPPLIVADERSAPYVATVRAALEKSYTSPKRNPEPVRRGLRGVSSLREFDTLMPFLVSLAEREYLRHGPIRRSESTRARYARPGPGVRPAYQPPKETPDV